MQLNNVKLVAKNLGGVISKNSSTILTGLAVGGLITTVILAVKATPKALEIIDDSKLSKDGETVVLDFTKKEIIQLTWKCYIPAAALGTATIVCIIGANHISLRRNAALASLYSITETAFKEYKGKVVETIGKGKEIKIRDEIAKDKILKNPPNSNEVIFTGKGEVLCLDSFSGRYFKSEIDRIRKIEYKQNRELRQEMFISLNDVYYELGLPSIKYGDEIGWNMDDGDIEFYFSSQLTEDEQPCLVVDYLVGPKWRFGEH